MMLEKKILALLKTENPHYKAQVSHQYHGASALPLYKSKLKFLGYRVPQTKKVSEEIFQRFHNFEEICDTFKESQIYEVKLVCLHIIILAYGSNSFKKEIEFIFYKDVNSLAKFVDCWPLADTLCSVLNNMFFENHEKFLNILIKLKNSENAWVERIGLVSVIYYTLPKKKPFALSFKGYLKLILKHKNSAHLYVQKGLGWQLRELGKAFPKEYEQWFETHGAKLSSVAFASASEKINKTVKKTVLEKRKL
jgi:3-methyladenine DNA glycosylase AlkD